VQVAVRVLAQRMSGKSDRFSVPKQLGLDFNNALKLTKENLKI
jgi:hypothetical protein